MTDNAFQVLEDCPECRVQSAMLTLVDPTVAQGVAVEASCRLCGRQERVGVVVTAGLRFVAIVDVIDALDRWAEREGEPDVEVFCRANMAGLSATEVSRRVVEGQVVETGFDVVAMLFPGMAGGGGGGGGGGGSTVPLEELRDRRRGPAPPSRPAGSAPAPGTIPVSPLPIPLEALQPRRTSDPFAKAAVAARALAAVMVADGQIKVTERRFLEAFLARAGLAALRPEDIRAWRPGELAIPNEPRPIVEAMIQLAHIDHEKDGSEWRVVREFARHWGYPLTELEARGRRLEESHAPIHTQIWRGLRSIFLTEQR